MSIATRSRLFFNVIKRFHITNESNRTYLQSNQINTNLFTSPISATTLITRTNLEFIRCKHKKSKKQDLTESEEEEDIDEYENEITDKQTKIINAKVNSLRADLILKAGLGIARNKIETMFYESKIRVNGRKLAKKSAMLNIGDEIDIIRGASTANPDFLTVSRVEILSASERNEGLKVKLRRNKSLTIENYDNEPT